MNVDNLVELLDPEPLPLEMGYERLPDGTLHVAARTDMPGCTGEMFEWWFRWFDTTQHYVWWHPGDHVFASWDDRWQAGVSYIDSTCTVDEKLAGEEIHRLLIHFVDPAELLGPGNFEKARTDGDASVAVTAIVGIGADAPVRDGRPLGGRLAHIGRDTPTGCTFLSRILPALYVAENRDHHPVPLPW